MVVLGWWMVRCSGRARRMRKRAAVDEEKKKKRKIPQAPQLLHVSGIREQDTITVQRINGY